MTLPTRQMLTADDEVRLAQRIEAGVYAEHLLGTGCPPYTSPAELTAVIDDGDAAWHAFFFATQRMAAAVANRWASYYRVDVDDVIQECYLALGGAIRDWDWKRGTRFSTLAWPRLILAARTCCLRRLGGGQAPDWYLRARLVTCVTGERTGTTVWVPPRRLSEKDDVVADLSANPADVVWARLTRLDPSSREIVTRRFGFAGERATYTQLAADLDLSPRAIKKIETKALDRLAEPALLPLAA